MDDFLTEQEVADSLRISRQTLQKWRADSCGPNYVLLGRRTVRYRKADIMKWVEESTKEPGLQKVQSE